MYKVPYSVAEFGLSSFLISFVRWKTIFSFKLYRNLSVNIVAFFYKKIENSPSSTPLYVFCCELKHPNFSRNCLQRSSQVGNVVIQSAYYAFTYEKRHERSVLPSVICLSNYKKNLYFLKTIVEQYKQHNFFFHRKAQIRWNPTWPGGGNGEEKPEVEREPVGGRRRRPPTKGSGKRTKRKWKYLLKTAWGRVFWWTVINNTFFRTLNNVPSLNAKLTDWCWTDWS